jgi:iron complex outermembrane receptor protein
VRTPFRLVSVLPAASLTVVMVFVVEAFAVEAPDQTAADRTAALQQIEEVVVTAEKRAENAQDVPVSITAVTPKQAVDFGAFRSDHLNQLVPGLQIQHELDSTTTFIRGVGPNSNGTGEESSVAVYLDDLYIEQGEASVFSLNAISRIEILKGPQGTLFGRNATGGVIQVFTLDPSFTPSLDAHIGYGNYDTKAGDLYATGSLIPGVLAANIALYEYNETAGWGRDILTGERAFTSEAWAARVKFLLTPTATTRVLLSLNHFYTRGEEGLGLNQVPQYIAAGAALLRTNATFVGWYNTEDYVNDVSVIKHDLIEARLEQDTGVAKFVDIMGWQRMNGNANFAQDATREALILGQLHKRGRNWSNELQILSPASAPYASWLNWVAGAYYLRDDSGYPNAVLRGTALGFPVSNPPDFSLLLNDNVSTESIAEFAQATVGVLPKTELTLGVRHTRDERTFTGGVYFSSAVPVVGGLPACAATALACPTISDSPGARHSWDMMNYRASLAHRFTDDVMGYFSFNQGVKSGQFDTFGTAFSGPIAAPPVNPERLHAYELGMKSEWDEHRVRLNLAAFHYEISNLQFATIVAGGTRLLNAARAEINGGELDATARVVPNFTISAGLSIQYGHYSSFPNAPAYFNPPSFIVDAKGNPTVHTPEFTGLLAADYLIPSTVGDFDLNASLTHTASFQFFPDKSLQQPETNIVNASLTWAHPSGRYDVRLWGANILGEKYYSFGSEALGLGKQFSPAPPATFGITLGWHMGA